MKAAALTFAIAVLSSSAFAQANPADHSAHHPGGATPTAGVSAPGPAPAQPAPDDKFVEQLNRMQDMHKRMQAAKTPAERKALAGEQMKLMQSGMEMMSQMRSGQGMGMGAMGAMGNSGGMGMEQPGAAPSAPASQASSSMGGMMGGMSGMMGMHMAMERRMALMEEMMQMMVDREAAAPRK